MNLLFFMFMVMRYVQDLLLALHLGHTVLGSASFPSAKKDTPMDEQIAKVVPVNGTFGLWIGDKWCIKVGRVQSDIKHQADKINAALAPILKSSRDAGFNEGVKASKEKLVMTKGEILLACGEMSASEMRAVKAVLGLVIRRIISLLRPEGKGEAPK